MEILTKKQKLVLDFISDYSLTNGLPPTMEEIRDSLGLKATSTVHEHIETLIRKGYLSKDSHAPRSLNPQKNTPSTVRIPIIGKIAAGYPIEAIEYLQDFVSIPNQDIDNIKNFYALRVNGNSMIDEGIFDGDLVIIRRQKSAENGQTVVAIIDEDQATLKKIYKEKGQFRLQPANQNLLPLYRKDVEIRGVVFQIIRNVTQSVESKKKSGGTISRSKEKSFRTIDLFAGVGGIRLGFERAGFETVFANDFEEKCKATYDLNFPTSKLVVEDIRKIEIDDLPEFDFLLGGFPCQAFSIAGYRKGFEDEKGRGNLFFDIARIIEARKPEGFLLENVKNLKTHDGGKTFSIIQDALADLGYHVKYKVLNSMEYGNIPQNRERIYIVGFKNKAYTDRFEFPEQKKLSVKITDILEKKVPEKYYYNDKPLFEKLKDSITEEGKVYQWRRQYVRENKKGVSPTLTANMGMGGHNVPLIKDKKGIRKLTPRECASLQGFPTDYALPEGMADSSLYKQFGNSVTVTVIEAVAKQMMQAMEN